MSVEHIIEQCSTLGLRLSTDGQSLNITGDKSNLIPELIAMLKENKTALITYIQRFAALEGERQRYRITPVDRNGLLPVSSAQRRIWLSQQMSDATATYNMPNGVHVVGEFDELMARQTMQMIVARHEALRTVVHYQGDQLVQTVHEAGDVDFIIEDYSHLSAAESEALALEFVRKDADRPFDLEHDLMLRGGFLRQSPERGILFFNVHHIAADGWSMALLLDEFKHIYNALFHGIAPQLPDVAVQYADYANWQSEMLSSDNVEGSKTYWLTQLQDLPSVHSIPLDFSRPASTGGRSDFRVAQLSASLSRKLKALATTRQTSLFVLFHAAISVVLGRYAGSDDVVVGTPVAGRKQKELEKTFGCFINNLVLRLRLDSKQSFAQLLSAAKQVNESALEHQDIPFEYLVEALKPERSNGYHPLFQIALVQNNLDISTEAEIPLAGEVVLQSFDSAELSAKYDIQINIVDTVDGIQVSFSFDTNLFKAETVARMTSQLQTICKQIADNIDTPIEQLVLTDDAELAQIQEWEQSAAYQGNNLPIHSYVEHWAGSNPDKPAICVAGNTLSYGEVNTRANQLARYLQSQGVSKGAFIGVTFERSTDLVIAMLAIVKAGAVYVPLDPDYPAARLQYMIADTALEQVLTTTALAPIFDQYEIAVAAIDALEIEAEIATHSSTNLDLTTSGDDLAYIIYTSGSTGKPKGVMVEHLGIERLVHNPNYVSLSSAENILFISNTAFDAATFEIWGALANGATLYGMDKACLLDANRFADEIRRMNISTAFITVALFNQIIAIRPGAFASLNNVMVGGEKLDKYTIDRALAYGKPTRLLNIYGPTENTTFSTYYEIEEIGRVQYPIGKAISGTGCYILDAEQQRSAVGVVGELYLSGIGLARGYLNKPDMTAERFVHVDSITSERLYRTGDMVKWDEKGNVCYIGRTDNQVKIRGFRIEIGEIEQALTNLTDVKEAAVQVETESGQKSLIAYVTCHQVQSVEAIKQALTPCLPLHMLPAQIVILEAMPLTANGKIDRARLVREQSNTATKLTPPSSALASVVANIWAVALQFAPEHIGMESNFFELGGHSLLAMNVVHKIHHAAQSEVPVQCLFEAPTLAQFTELVAQYQHTTSLLSVTKAPSSEQGYPLSAAQRRMWFIDQLGNGSTQYNLNYQFEVRGDFNIDSAERAFLSLLQRHEVLRTSYHETDEGEIQQVQPISAFTIAHYHTSAEHYADELMRVQSELNESFDLTCSPLIRVAYIDGAAQNSGTLLLCLHHIATDGWSMNILFNEFAELYRGEQEGKKPNLPHNALSYTDYAVWQQTYLTSESCLASLEHWQECLKDAPAEHGITLDFPRPKIKQQAGAVVTQVLAKAEALALKDFIGTHNLTPFMLAHAALSLVVAQHGRESQCVIGAPVAGRHDQKLADLIGLFVNTIALTAHTDFATLGEYLAHIRDVNIAAQSHNLVPFDLVVDALNVNRSAAISPVFQIMLTTDGEDSFRFNKADSIEALSGVEFTSLTDGKITTKFDLDVHFELSDHQLTVNWVYDISLFKASSIERLSEQMMQLLRALVKGNLQRDIMTLPMSALTLCNEVQTTALLAKLNPLDSTQPVVAESLVTCWSDTVAKHATNIALHWQDQSWTFQVLASRVAKCAQVLQTVHGIERGQVIAVQMDKSDEMVVALLAIMTAGAAYLPLDPSAPQERIDFVLADAKASLLISQPGYQTRFDSAQCPSTTVNMLEAAQVAGEVTSVIVSAEDLAYVIYTSGTTGQPKGVMVSHRNAVSLMEEMQRWPICQGEQNWGWNANYVFDASLQGLLQLIAGMALTPIPETLKLQPQQLGEYLSDNNVTVLDCTPSLVEMWLDEDLDAQLPNLIIGGEAISESLWQRLVKWQHQHDRTALNVYGPTECTVNATVAEISGSCPHLGLPLSNTRLYVFDDHQRLVAEGMSGELYISGEGVAEGYLGKPELTASCFIDNPFGYHQSCHARLYKTGDIVRFSDGILHYVGRADSQVKLNGYRIELAEIEQHLFALPDVVRAHVMISYLASGTPMLVAYVQGVSEVLDSTGLSATLSAKLPSYMIPQQYIAMTHWPVTRNGKLDISALPQVEVEPSGDSLSTETECKLAEVWQAVLRLPTDTLLFKGSSFFELGGNSLQAVALVRAIKKTFNVQLNALDVFQQQTLSSLAAKVDAMDSYGDLKQLVCLREGDDQQPPIVFIHPVGGQLTCYAQLVSELETNAPIYGLQSTTLQFRSITALSTHYLSLLEVDIEHPNYHLIGWSMGGVIGHTMQRLAQEKVLSLTMIDSYVPELHRNIEQSELQRLGAFAEELGVSLDGIAVEDVQHLDHEQRLAMLHQLCVTQHLVSKAFTLMDLQMQWQILSHNHALFSAHTCIPSASSARLIYASDFTAVEGWSTRLSHCEAFGIEDTDHHAIMKENELKTLINKHLN
ncbi:non-ribosomal peptide synthetase [Pseudoalteromonas sp. NJ631]|uniref:non-ribosomal peptide synthetase n=1 Tax=Pseudoalteromonas sp. NJ631 TaxID=493915 RepID=UPI00026E0ABC|nr:non-ribosomal peptide synthetase [Pseudoalteromonas sp. NJ631]AFN43013.1 non-ribosomal peptide synthase PNJ1110 [Pseudoalteromonas sp. NJ631]